jgi:uncharacterized membrane protein YhaH (DUF805 family)
LATSRQFGGTLSFGQAITAFWSNYANFKGRARRSEYWFATLFLVITNISALILDAAAETDPVIQSLWSLAVFLPSLAVLVRRLHDTNRSGWWVLIALVPLVGLIVLIVFTVQDSQVIDNRYGLNPKAS